MILHKSPSCTLTLLLSASVYRVNYIELSLPIVLIILLINDLYYYCWIFV